MKSPLVSVRGERARATKPRMSFTAWVPTPRCNLPAAPPGRPPSLLSSLGWNFLKTLCTETRKEGAGGPALVHIPLFQTPPLVYRGQTDLFYYFYFILFFFC